MRLILQLCVMVLMLLGAGNRVWGKVAVGQNIAVRGFAEGGAFGNEVDEPPALMSSGEAAAWGYDCTVDVRDSPNVYAYVKQNPWTAFDPRGLATVLTNLPPREAKHESVGQLGISSNKNTKSYITSSARNPVTVCLFDGGETRPKSKTTADKDSLRLTAETYASGDPKNGDKPMTVDISDPKWKDHLQKFKDKLQATGGIDRIMIVDHGSPKGQEFGPQGTILQPQSPEWMAISSAVKPRGSIVLMGCEVAGKEVTRQHPKTFEPMIATITKDGRDYIEQLYIHSSASTRPTIHAYDENVTHAIGRFQHATTTGSEYSIPQQ